MHTVIRPATPVSTGTHSSSSTGAEQADAGRDLEESVRSGVPSSGRGGPVEQLCPLPVVEVDLLSAPGSECSRLRLRVIVTSRADTKDFSCCRLMSRFRAP